MSEPDCTSDSRSATAAVSPACAAGRAATLGVKPRVYDPTSPKRLARPTARALRPPSVRGVAASAAACCGVHLCMVVVSAARSLRVGTLCAATSSWAATPASTPAPMSSGVTSPGGSSVSPTSRSSSVPSACGVRSLSCCAGAPAITSRSTSETCPGCTTLPENLAITYLH